MNRESASVSNSVHRRGIPMRFDRYPWLSQDQDLFFGQAPLHAIVQPKNPMLQSLCHLEPAPTLQRSSGTD